MPNHRKHTAIDNVVAHMRQHISRNGLHPGDALPSEIDLSRDLGISRATVREASRRLSALGLIDVGVGKRPRVSSLKPDVLHEIVSDALITGQMKTSDILEVRSGIEIAMASLAARRRTAATVESLTAIVDDMNGKLHDLEAYSDLDFRFHGTLATATGSAFYIFLLNGCHAAFRDSMAIGHRSRRDETELQHVQQLHVSIADAVRRGDAEAAAAAMHSHFTDAIAAVNRSPITPVSRTTTPPSKPREDLDEHRYGIIQDSP
jgi:DNA-binding FadR family transcriptional regulator